MSGVLFTLGTVSLVFALSACIKRPARDPHDDDFCLSRYLLRRGPIVVAGVAANASDLVYAPPTGTFLLITNDLPAIHELSLDGEPLRCISLAGFDDTEGLAHVQGTLYAIAEERRNTLALVTITPETRRIARAEARLIALEATEGGNKGLEGVTYDAARQQLLVVKEKRPRGFYQVTRWMGGANSPEVVFKPVRAWAWLGMADFSAIHHHPASAHRFVLSDESRRVEQRSADGVLIDSLSLRRGASGLAEDIPQPEGITIAPDGTIYLCSEPNLLYIFSKIPRS